MPNSGEFEILALAAWRASHIITRESGPGAVFRALREDIGIDDGSIGELLSCIWCMSVWAGLVVYALWQVKAARPIVYALALSAYGLMRASETGVSARYET